MKQQKPQYVPMHAAVKSDAVREARDLRRASSVLASVLWSGSDEASLLAAVLFAGPLGEALAAA